VRGLAARGDQKKKGRKGESSREIWVPKKEGRFLKVSLRKDFLNKREKVSMEQYFKRQQRRSQKEGSRAIT